MIVAAVPVKELSDLAKAHHALSTPLVDAVELRLDYLPSLDDMLRVVREASEAGILSRSIVTVRAWWEGGVNKFSDEERINVLRAALDHGAMLVDLEVYTLERVDLKQLEGFDWRRTLLSLHVDVENYNDGMAEYLLSSAKRLGAWGAKLAVKADLPERVSSILYWFLSEAARRNIRVAVMPYGCCMGLRLALYAAGSELLYVCASEDIGGTATGQPCLSRDTDRSLVECVKRLRMVAMRP
ncbi:dehydroquinase class I [Pyrolobus fumarii 1A]|uniref:3-dehydroquinate dehydratase n=1 Tax=Pyrolobus fumarii (strain DSM 11204 / 1A) TaxID=694429 RepID=G0EDV3_PYRF1|nr:type I 3-dehydroquinate dehydratase [Pyrolobus fumarii]AEM38722.1 dehydroquinase class I [Pyrolobus fumarii 1A]